ncbi:MAG: hypothetical protein JWN40_2536 [Phycisphaerales bacterium]|nr:hypothetical protein [Phycisphaerales bacterium]
MFTLYRRLAKIILVLAWASATALSIYAWKTDRAVFGNYESREIVLADGTHRPVEQPEIKSLAGHHDAAAVRVRRITADRWRGSLAITATSMTYRMDGPDALKYYYEENGFPDNNPFQSFGDPPFARRFYRLPLSRDRSMVWDIVPQLPPPDYKLHYTFVRTNDPHRTGWDLELRLPFWIIWTSLSLPMLCYSGVKGFRSIRRRARHIRRRCVRCNYDLRASTDRCPECGHPIPAVPTTSATPPAPPHAAHLPQTKK